MTVINSRFHCSGHCFVAIILLKILVTGTARRDRNLPCNLLQGSGYSLSYFFRSSICPTVPGARAFLPHLSTHALKCERITAMSYNFRITCAHYFLTLQLSTSLRGWENRSSWTSPLGPVGCPFHGHNRKGEFDIRTYSFHVISFGFKLA